jgi:hypothetical protein
VGFYLWMDGELAWAQGTYEYRPMGTAVIAASDLFRRRDFDPRRKAYLPPTAQYAGQFASLGHVNSQLQRRRGNLKPAIMEPPAARSR